MLINYTGESKVISRICELINTMTGVNFEVVQTLPTTDISTSTIYLVPKQSAGVDNIYDEYINTDGTSQGWELIGTTEIDLSNYYTKTEVNNLIPDELKDLSDDSTHRLVTDTEKSKWNSTAVYKELSNQDLNAINEVGFYVGKSGNTCTNKPTGIAQFGLIVIRTATSQSTYFEQILIAPTGELYFRRQYGAVQGWNNWVGLTIPSNNGTIALQETFSPTEPEPASQDLNDYKESGVYYFTSTNAPLNVPIGSNGMLVVFTAVTDSANNRILVKQIWLRHGTQNSNDYHTYIRTYRTDLDTWSNWHRVITSEGGAISGNITIVVPNTATTTTNSGINLGNNIPVGTEGTTRGVLNIYGLGANYVQFVDGQNVAITRNSTLYLPNKSGVLAVFEDLNLTQLNDRSLMYPPYYRSTPYTYREVEYTYTPDGTLTANGTATGGNSNFHYRVYASNQYIKGGKAYYFKACPSGGSDSKYWGELSFGDDNNTTLLTVKDYGDGVKVVAPTNAVKISSQFVIKSGYTVNNLSFKPILTPYDGWLDLGSTNTGTITVNDVYSEYMAEVTLNCTYSGTTYTRNFIYNFLPNSLSSTAKSFMQTAPCQTQQIGGVVYMHCSTSAKKENNQVTIASGGTWTGGMGGTASPIFTSATIQLYAKA